MKTLEAQLQPYLCPAGDGVFTVSSAKDYKDKLQQQLYGTIGSAVQQQWQQHLSQLSKNTQTKILGICSDAGGGILRGANWGPLFIRHSLYQRIDPNSVCDLGDIRIIPQLLLDEYHSEAVLTQCRQALYGRNHLENPVSPLSITEKVVSQLLHDSSHHRIIALGGDHSVSYALTKAYLSHKKQQGIKAALIHFDAHTDLLPSRLGIPVCFGSWTYHILPLLAAPANLIQIGIRASQKPQTEWEQQFGIKQFWAHQVNALSTQALCEQLLDHLAQQYITELYISVDIDALDISQASATGTPEAQGLYSDTVINVIHTLSQHYPLMAADLMEVAPFNIPLNSPDRIMEPQRTLNHAAAIAHCLITSCQTSHTDVTVS